MTARNNISAMAFYLHLMVGHSKTLGQPWLCQFIESLTSWNSSQCRASFSNTHLQTFTLHVKSKYSLLSCPEGFHIPSTTLSTANYEMQSILGQTERGGLFHQVEITDRSRIGPIQPIKSGPPFNHAIVHQRLFCRHVLKQALTNGTVPSVNQFNKFPPRLLSLN